MPPLKGILHAAATFDDRLIANLDAESLQSVLRPKLLGAWNLHTLTTGIPIDYFVLYSSITTYIGNPGQANYVAANAGLEGLAEMRNVMGLPATCIGWGPISDTGYLARNASIKDSLAQRLGKTPLSSAESLMQLDRILTQENGPAAIASFDWSVLSRFLPAASSNRFAALNRNLKEVGLSEDNVDIRTLIAGKPAGEIAKIVCNLVTQEVAQILCIGAERIEPNRSLHDLGLDSLMAVELALGLEQRFCIQLPVMMLNESPTAERVTARIVEKLLGSGGPDESGTTGALVKDLIRQHGEDVSPEEVECMTEDARILAEKGARLIA
jgi:acyl carrier protein